jgi:ABC-type spermidine/putrescine transport system permease subunit I
MFERRQTRLALYFVAPAVTFFMIILVLPLWGVVEQSFTSEEEKFTLAGYRDLETSLLFHKVLWNTFEISFMATVLTLLLAYPVAYHLAKQPPRRRAFLMVLILLPFWTSILVKSFAFLVILGENGIVNQGLRWIPGVEHGIRLMFNRAGVMIGLMHFFIPFMVFPILTSLLAQNPDLPKAAQVMGSGAARIFFRITLPLSMPGVIAGCMLVFIICLGFFITPELLGGRKDMMVANIIDFYTRETLNWTFASSIAVVLLLLSGLFIFALSCVPGGRAFVEGVK